MEIGIAREKLPGESRVTILPEEVKLLVKAGHKVFVEKDAGIDVFVSNEEYTRAGARIVEDPVEIYSKDIVVKLKAPSPEEFQMLKMKDNIILSMFHHLQQPWNIDLLKAANSVVVALELLQNEAGERLVNCNRMAGQQGMLLAFHHAPKTPEECKILMLGYGEVAAGALAVAFSLGSYVKILRRAEFPHIRHFMEGKDMVVNAIKWPKEKSNRKERLISRPMLKLLNRGSLVLDLSVDYPGPIETTHPTTVLEPFYFEEGVKHISIYGYPALSPISSSRRYSAQVAPIVLEIADKGLENAAEYIRKAVISPA